LFILSKKYGRLCNRLFSAAHILALAIEHNHTFVNLSFYEYAEHFRATQNDVFCRYPMHYGAAKSHKKTASALYYLSYFFSYFLYYLSKAGISTHRLALRTVRPFGKKDDIIDIASLPIDYANTNQLIFFQGWNLRSFECVKKHGDKIREYFQPADVYQADIQEYIKANREGYDLLIGVVIRHGDYQRYLNGKYYYPVGKYVNLMTGLKVQLPGKRVKFLIFSDEEQDTTAFDAAGIAYSFRSGHMIENLYSLAECDYIVTPPSTYGMWASFYGRVPICLIEDPDKIPSIADNFSVYQG
jgi:hypothetical protein